MKETPVKVERNMKYKYLICYSHIYLGKYIVVKFIDVFDKEIKTEQDIKELEQRLRILSDNDTITVVSFVKLDLSEW